MSGLLGLAHFPLIWVISSTARPQAVQLAAALPLARTAMRDELSTLYGPIVESTNSNTSTEIVEEQVVVVGLNEVRPWLEEMQYKLLACARYHMSWVSV